MPAAFAGTGSGSVTPGATCLSRDFPVPILKILSVLLLCATMAACKSSEDRAEEAYQRGIALLEEGDVDRARIEFRNAIRLSAVHQGAQTELGRLNMEDGSLRPAFRNYRTVVELDPDNAEAHRILGQITFLVQDWENFDRHVQRARELSPDHPDTAVLELARSYRQAAIDSDDPKLDALTEEAAALDASVADSPVLRRVLIDGYLRDQRYEEALVQIDRAIESNPRDQTFYQTKLQVLAQIEDAERLEAALRQMAEMFPKDEQVKSNLLRFLIASEDIDGAESFLREEVARDGATANMVSLVQFLQRFRGMEAALAEIETQLQARPGDSTLTVLRATLKYTDGQQDAAIAELESLIADAEGNEEIAEDDVLSYKVMLAQMLGGTGNEVGARKLVEEVLEQNPSDVGALKMQARWLIREDDTNAAISAMRTALAESPQDSEAMLIMAAAYARAGNTPLQLDFLSLAVEASNNAPGPSLRYARVLLDQGEIAQAETVLFNALRMQPRNPTLLSAIGRIYLQQEQAARVGQVIAALREIGTPATDSEADVLQLELVSRQQGAGEALKFLEQMSETHSENSRIKLALIQGRLETGDSAGALDYAEELVAEEPGNDDYVFFLALTQAATGDLEAAKQGLRELLSRSPEAVRAWLQLARLQSLSGETESVGATVAEGLAQNPDSPDLQWAHASYLEQNGDIDGAIAVYEEMYDRNSGSLLVANNLASLLSTYKTDAASLERARTIARRLRDTDIPAMQDTYGWIQYRSGDADAALPYLESAAEGLPEDPNVQVHLGFAYHALGRQEAAREQLNRAREAAGPVALQETRDKIAELDAALKGAPGAQATEAPSTGTQSTGTAPAGTGD